VTRFDQGVFCPAGKHFICSSDECLVGYVNAYCLSDLPVRKATQGRMPCPCGKDCDEDKFFTMESLRKVVPGKCIERMIQSLNELKEAEVAAEAEKQLKRKEDE
jgi:hypothetical protein